MLNPQNLTTQQRIKLYREEITRHKGRPGYRDKFLLKVYEGLLEASEEELINKPPPKH